MSTDSPIDWKDILPAWALDTKSILDGLELLEDEDRLAPKKILNDMGSSVSPLVDEEIHEEWYEEVRSDFHETAVQNVKSRSQADYQAALSESEIVKEKIETLDSIEQALNDSAKHAQSTIDRAQSVVQDWWVKAVASVPTDTLEPRSKAKKYFDLADVSDVNPSKSPYRDELQTELERMNAAQRRMDEIGNAEALLIRAKIWTGLEKEIYDSLKISLDHDKESGDDIRGASGAVQSKKEDQIPDRYERRIRNLLPYLDPEKTVQDMCAEADPRAEGNSVRKDLKAKFVTHQNFDGRLDSAAFCDLVRAEAARLDVEVEKVEKVEEVEKSRGAGTDS